MGANLLVLLSIAAPLQSPPPDTTPPYSSPAVQQLVERAMARRRASDSLVRDYQATIRYRLSVGVGRRVWSKVPASAVEEQVARVQWQQPNDLRVDVIGRRFQTRNRTLQLSSVWDRPWFVPRGVDDSVRIFSNDFPATGRAASARELGPRVVPLRPDGGADGDARPRRGASPAPGGGHAETRGPGADRGPDVDRFGDRGGGPTHLPLPRHRALGPARRRDRAGPTRRRRAGSTRSPTGS